MKKDNTYIKYASGSEELVQCLVDDHRDWAISIAKTIARSWNLDWQLDGIDGGAFEALLFCARRYDPSVGVPFRAYARKRIHESCTVEAKASKSWKYTTGSGENNNEIQEREVSFKLFSIFPELREGMSLTTEDSQNVNIPDSFLRATVKILLASASLISMAQETQELNTPDSALEMTNILGMLADLGSVHQNILWFVYWQDYSLRSLAEEWGVDELVVIREHQTLIEYLSKRFQNARGHRVDLKLRPKLRPLGEILNDSEHEFPFKKFKKEKL
jgi:DNA-directed RNA polymerase specialized sigma subunit